MASLLISLIYLAFISLGLPDSLLGSAWPVMHVDLGMPLSAMGILTMIISGCTVISSLLSDRLTHRFGTRAIVTFCVGLTAVGLIGFSLARAFWLLCLISIPYGMGAGSIDAALNNYVALHYSSRHMNWLHSFWGLGAIISPYIMGYSLSLDFGWRGGYMAVGIIQSAILFILIVTLPVWSMAEKGFTREEEEIPSEPIGLIKTLKIPGVIYILIGFLGYCAAEATVMLWASSYFFQTQPISEELAAALGSLFFIGITAGRFIIGFFSNRIADKTMIRLGLLVGGIGVIIIALPVHSIIVPIVGFLLIGLGFAPIYPSIIHSTPESFGKDNSHSIIGIQMASAYIGSTLTPPLFGLVAEFISIRLLPIFLLLFVALTFVMTELVARTTKR